MKYIILTYCLFLFACDNNVAEQKDSVEKQTDSIKEEKLLSESFSDTLNLGSTREKLLSRSFFDRPSINDIPLMTKETGTISTHNELRNRLEELNLLDASDTEAIVATPWQKVNERFTKAIQQNKINDTDLEYESVIILKSMRVLKESTPEALTAIKFHLDNLLRINSNNTILYFYCLNAIKSTLKQEEVKKYVEEILSKVSDNKNYLNAIDLKKRMVKLLEEKPEYYEKLANDARFSTTLKILNTQILAQEYYLKQIKNLSKIE